MNIRDLFDPQRAISFSFKLFIALLGLLLAPSVIAIVIAALPGRILLALPVISYVAYRMLQRSRPRAVPARTSAGAERTPVVPQLGDN